jgi:hypothetical protein
MHILLRPVSLLDLKDYKFVGLSYFLTMGVPDDGYPRHMLCALRFYVFFKIKNSNFN